MKRIAMTLAAVLLVTTTVFAASETISAEARLDRAIAIAKTGDTEQMIQELKDLELHVSKKYGADLSIGLYAVNFADLKTANDLVYVADLSTNFSIGLYKYRVKAKDLSGVEVRDIRELEVMADMTANYLRSQAMSFVINQSAPAMEKLREHMNQLLLQYPNQ